MDDKEKAIHLAEDNLDRCFGSERDYGVTCALEMAQWKNKQLREKLKKKMNFFYPPIDDYNEGNLAVLKDLYQELFNEYYV